MIRVVFLAALTLSWSQMVFAQSPDDEYVRIYNLIQDSDRLAGERQAAPAEKGYLEARNALESLQKARPDWNPEVVSFRLRYIAERLQKLPRGPDPREEPAKDSSRDLPATQLQLLQGQVRQLAADKEMLQAKLTEALSAQPAAVDPRELTKANARIKSLEKEIEILRVNLDKAEARPERRPSRKEVEDSRKALADANQTIELQKDTIMALETRLRVVSGDSRMAALEAENQNLKRQVVELQSAPQNGKSTDSFQKQLDSLRNELADARSRNEILSQEKEILKARLNEVASLRQTELPARTRAAARDQTEGSASAQDNAAIIAVLRSAVARANEEKASLEKTVAALQAREGAPGREEASRTQDIARITQLQRERDELQGRLSTVSRELFDLKTGTRPANSELLTNQLAALRAKLSILEARQVPYSPEELALLRLPEIRRAEAASEKNAPARSRELTAVSVQLVAEAGRDFNAGRLTEAETKYREALKTDDGNVRLLADLAAVQLRQGHLEEAEKTLRRALDDSPNDTRSLSLFGALRIRQGKFDDALDALSRSAQLDPQNAETHNYLGYVLAEKGLRGPAESALRRAIQLSPGYGEAHENLAVVYSSQQPPAMELAQWHYQKALGAGQPRNRDLEKKLNERKLAGTAK